MTPHPTPAPGDIWFYDSSSYHHKRKVHVLVMRWDGEQNAYQCLTLETGVVEYWHLNVVDDPHMWSYIA